MIAPPALRAMDAGRPLVEKLDDANKALTYARITPQLRPER
jgi:hypothetical protein